MSTRYYKSYYLPGPPTKCDDGRPAPKCNYYDARGARIDTAKCKCVPICAQGLYYWNGDGKCRTKADHDRKIKEGQDYAKYINDCQNRGGYVMNDKCIVDKDSVNIPGIGGIPLPWLVAGALGLVVIVLLATRK